MSLTIIRVEENDWIYDEVEEGRVRVGWGGEELNLLDEENNLIPRDVWEETYWDVYGDKPPRSRYTILTRMHNNLGIGDVVVVPNMREDDRFAIASVHRGYRFGNYRGLPLDLSDDYRHYIDLHQKSVRIFNNRANLHAFQIFSLINSAQQAVSCPIVDKEIEIAADALLKMNNILEANYESNEIYRPALDLKMSLGEYYSHEEDIILTSKDILERMGNWNRVHFEEEVRRAFRSHRYTIRSVLPGSDTYKEDYLLLAFPPSNEDDLFFYETPEVLVVVAHRVGEDLWDESSINRIVNWHELYGNDNLKKCVMSSVRSFSDETRKLAEENDVMLVCGLQTASFLEHSSNLYRQDWDTR